MIHELKTKGNASIGLVWLIWPLMALVESIRNYRESWAKNGIWLFVIFFGFTLVPREGLDSMGAALRLQEYHAAHFDLSTIFGMLLVEGSRYLDVAQLLIIFVVSRFTDDHRILFMVIGIIFGYFYSRNLWMLLTATKGKLGTVEKILIVAFAFVIPIWYMNGIRFWTAAHIFIYGAFQVFLYRKPRGFLIAALSILMHFSYVFPVLIFGAYLLLGNRTVIYFGFFLVSLIISGLDPMFLQQTLTQFLPEVLHDRVSIYTNIDLIANRGDAYAGANFYARYYKPSMKIGISAMLIIVFLSGRKFWQQKQVWGMYSFVLLFTGFANMVSSISSLGRFDKMIQAISVACLFLFFHNLPKEHPARSWFYLALPFLFLYFFTIFRFGMDLTGIQALMSNPVFAPFFSEGTALIDFIK